MCRLFALVSSKEGSREFYDLMGPFKAQADKHPDGWGIAWYADGSPSVVKSPLKADQDKEFMNVVKKVRSPLIMAHLRQASIGEKTVENTHPFVQGKWTFAHNGTFHTKPELKEKLPTEYQARLKGTTDSEALFQWIMCNIDRKKDPVKGIREAMGWVRENLGPHVTALNFLLTDGKRLYAYRYAYCRPFLYSLYYAVRTPTLDHPNSSIVFSSEHLTGEAWRPVDNGVLVETILDGTGKISTNIYQNI
jgi:predicted glutamine amidotransferase